ncbi:hypothetical protein [Nocardioides lijunqiniae]|uniref:hypothetical protein n=1 Tax=Nocardioides lijunqiniae TaxID=2760832 RepID=UPI00187895B9|nr:hypothetical protein [Nocardioides lijunqiniae]
MEQQPVDTRSWAVTKDDVPHQLSLSKEGLTLRESAGEGFAHYPLRELRVASFPTPMSVELLTDSGVVALDFHAGTIQRELRAALEELAVTVRTPASRTAGLLDAIDETPLPAKYVDGFGFLVVGLCVLVVGAFVFLLASNSAEGDSGSGTTIGFVFAWLVMTLGSLLAGIGVVGIGVTIGIRRAVDLMGPPSTWGQRR